MSAPSPSIVSSKSSTEWKKYETNHEKKGRRKVRRQTRTAGAAVGGAVVGGLIGGPIGAIAVGEEKGVRTTAWLNNRFSPRTHQRKDMRSCEEAPDSDHFVAVMQRIR